MRLSALIQFSESSDKFGSQLANDAGALRNTDGLYQFGQIFTGDCLTEITTIECDQRPQG